MAALVCKFCCQDCCRCKAACNRVFCDPDHPFPFLQAFTFGTNIIPGLIGIAGLALDWQHDCGTPLHIFLLVQFFIGVLNFAFSVYLVSQLGKKGEDSAKEVGQKVWKVLCYDPYVCVYMVFAVFAIVWAIVGVVWVSGANCSSGSFLLFIFSVISLVMIWVYIFLSMFFMCCGVMCQCFHVMPRGAQKVMKV